MNVLKHSTLRIYQRENSVWKTIHLTLYTLPKRFIKVKKKKWNIPKHNINLWNVQHNFAVWNVDRVVLPLWKICICSDYFFFFFVLDLSVGLISVLTDLIWRMTVSWNAGNAMCKFVRFLQVVVTYGSTYILVALSIDRYDAITHPMKFSGSCK